MPDMRCNFRFRKSNEMDSSFVRYTRNLPAIRKAAGVPKLITPTEHAGWWKKHGKEVYIISVGDMDAGIMRVSSEGIISLAIAPEYQYRGLGREALAFAKTLSPKLVVEVRWDNLGSQEFFGRAGFKPTKLVMEWRGRHV